jgi:hypothetical protein
MAAIYKHGGLLRCYHGLGIQLARDIPASALYFLLFEYQYDQMMARGLSDRSGVVASLAAGGVAGVVSWAAVMQLDVVKSLIQADYKRERFSSVWQCARHLYQTQGSSAFFTGFQACAYRAFVTNAIIFAVHKQALRFLHRIHSEPQ